MWWRDREGRRGLKRFLDVVAGEGKKAVLWNGGERGGRVEVWVGFGS